MSEALVEEVSPDTRFEIAVIYNGITRQVAVNSNELIQAVLQHAIQAFGSLPNPHTLSLFTESGVELPDNIRVRDAGITKDTTLLLRPSQVKGGGTMSAYGVPQGLLARTFEHFRDCGRGERECQLLWTSPWSSPGIITDVVHPKHRARGGGFELDSDWLNAFWLELARSGKGIRVQVHTHPFEAFHSDTDDEFPIVHTVGFLSLVIPNFAIGRVGFEDAYLTEIGEDGRWRQVSISDRLELV